MVSIVVLVAKEKSVTTSILPNLTTSLLLFATRLSAGSPLPMLSIGCLARALQVRLLDFVITTLGVLWLSFCFPINAPSNNSQFIVPFILY